MDTRTLHCIAPDQAQDASLLADAMPIGVLIVDQQGMITLVNRQLEQMFGYSRDTLIGKPLESLLPGEMRDLHRALRNKYLAQPTQRSMGQGLDLFGQRRNGESFPVEIGLNPIQTADGPAIVATVSDISQRRQLENTAKQLIEAAPCGMLMVDTDNRITLANRQLCDLFGYDHQELIGQPLDILLPERYRHEHGKHLAGYRDKPDNRAMGPGRDLTGLHRNGTEFPVEIGLSALNCSSGNVLMATVIDISERKRMELNLRQANESLDEFTYTASHDLRSPLRGIADLLEWVEEDMGEGLAPEVVHNLDRIKLRIGRMEQLIEDLLVYARAGYQTTEFTRIELPTLLDDIIDMQAPPPGFSIEHDCSITDIVAPKTPLETVLRNLISNAIKHHDRDQGRIKISAEPANSQVVFTVSDDGPGIRPEVQERIFKLFQTLNSSSGTSGIGLAVSKRLVNAHGGSMTISANPEGRGCSFRFSWPRFVRRDLDD